MMSMKLHALKLITKAKVLILQFLVLDAQPLHFMMLVASPAAAYARPAQVDKKAGDKNADDERRKEWQRSLNKICDAK